MKASKPTPLGAVARGLISSAVGTAAMDLVWFARYRRGGGTDKLVNWEFSSGLTDRESAPAPAQFAKRVMEGFLQREIPPERAPLIDNVVHWSYGMLWGALYVIPFEILSATSEGRYRFRRGANYLRASQRHREGVRKT